MFKIDARSRKSFDFYHYFNKKPNSEKIILTSIDKDSNYDKLYDKHITINHKTDSCNSRFTQLSRNKTKLLKNEYISSVITPLNEQKSMKNFNRILENKVIFDRKCDLINLDKIIIHKNDTNTVFTIKKKQNLVLKAVKLDVNKVMWMNNNTERFIKKY